MKSLDQSSCIPSRTRGRLVSPSKDLVGVLEQAELEWNVEQLLSLKNSLTFHPM